MKSDRKSAGGKCDEVQMWIVVLICCCIMIWTAIG